MCGISGIINRNGPVREDLVGLMNRRMVYRGPDESGIWNNENVALGHNRLSIIDLSTGKQPMEDSDRRFIIVYNGELYNYKELREKLEAAGMKFKTNSDTEVILNAYKKYGRKSLDWFEGMYAYAIYDRKRKRLFSARDRLGKKPLYYYFDDKYFLFSSELSGLKATGMVCEKISYKALGYYLTLNYIPSPYCIFESVKKLPHAHWLELDMETWRVEISKYWDTPEEQIPSLPDEDTIPTLRRLLDEAVRKRLVSDVPLGAFLSGGLDSSAIVAFMSRHQDSPRTFSVSFSETDYDESVYARKVAAHFGTEHTELKIDFKDVDGLKRILTASGEPFGDPTLLPTYYMSQVAKKYVTVCLSGDGADEVFGGYPKFFGRSRGLDSPLIRKILDGTPPFRGKHRLFKKVLNEEDAYYESLCRYSGYCGEFNSLKSLLKPEVYEDIVSSGFDLRDFLGGYHKSKKYDLLSGRFYLDLNTYMVDNCLVKVDRGSMLASLEVRNPYLDHKLVEYVYSIPGRHVAGPDNYKALLKEALKGIVPDFVINREKKGFNVPISEWMRTHWRETIEDVLFRDSIFNPKYLRKIWDGHLSGKQDNMYRIWLPFVFNLNFTNQ